MAVVEWLLLIFLIVCALSVCIARDLLNSVVIFMSYSLVMSVVWVLLRAPDLAITEAAVGAGVTTGTSVGAAVTAGAAVGWAVGAGVGAPSVTVRDSRRAVPV